jgi:conjugative coupling factor TraD (SXT/TOL subfamily)
MEKLTTGKVAELISPDYMNLDDHRPILDWMQVFRQNAVVYIGLDAMTDTVVSSAVGASMFADMCSTAGRIYNRGRFDGLPALSGAEEKLRKIAIHADEFNELIGDQMIPLLNKAGGADYQLTVYTQTLSDIQARLGDQAKTGQVLGNINTILMMRVKELATAEYLTQQLPFYKVAEMMAVSGANDSADPTSGVDFTSRNEDRISKAEAPALLPNDIMTLPKGQAFALLDGGRLAKIRMPLPMEDRDHGDLPTNVVELAERMKRQYQTGEDWYVDNYSWARNNDWVGLNEAVDGG